MRLEMAKYVLNLYVYYLLSSHNYSRNYSRACRLGCQWAALATKVLRAGAGRLGGRAHALFQASDLAADVLGVSPHSSAGDALRVWCV